MATVEVKKVSKTYKDINLGKEVPALQEINLTVKENDFFVFLGPSGCGKSTLLNIIAGLVPFDAGGEVMIDGSRVSGPNPKKIAFMFQDSVLFPWRKIIKNVEFGLEAQRISKEERRKRAMKYLTMVGLEGFVDSYPRQLSGGMNQRVALCRALAMETDIILMDEPFGALDEQTRTILGDELVEIWRQVGRTVIFVTHSLNEAVYLAERIAIFTARPGKIKRIVDVSIPRPRTPNSPDFLKLVNLIWQEIRDESTKAIGREVKPLQEKVLEGIIAGERG
jgi:NitT/TauT family transport system ATP-binding protein